MDLIRNLVTDSKRKPNLAQASPFSSHHPFLFSPIVIVVSIVSLLLLLLILNHLFQFQETEKAIMDSEQMSKKDLKVEIPAETEHMAGGVSVEAHHPVPVPGQGASSGLSRQPSVTKTNCLCSPTTHAGSFRCRLHRAPTLQRTKSIDSQPASLRDSTSKPNSATAAAE